jgi:hypothetical protein
MSTSRTRERPEKILVAMLRLSSGTTRSLKYEDIVVEAFKMFPDEFALRGHPEYPDSSDIHKPLYSVLKRGGFIRSSNKTFALTARGVEKAQELRRGAGDQIDVPRDGRRMPRDAQLEVERMAKSAAYVLFVNEQPEKILDTDFFAFLGCTVRTPRNDFAGRVATIESAIATANEIGQPDEETATSLKKAWAFLRKKFQSLIERRNGGR